MLPTTVTRVGLLATFDSPTLPPVTLRHTSRDPPKVRHTSRNPPIFRRPSTKTQKKAPLYKFCLNCSRGFCPGVLSGGLLFGRFCSGWFLSISVLSEYICYIRKLNITLNFMFRMCGTFFFISVTSHALYPPPPCHKLSHFLGPLPPLERDVLYGRPLRGSSITNCCIFYVSLSFKQSSFLKLIIF